MLLVSATDVVCSGQKDPCASIKPEKLLLKGEAKRYTNTQVQTKFYEESWSVLSL